MIGGTLTILTEDGADLRIYRNNNLIADSSGSSGVYNLSSDEKNVNGKPGYKTYFLLSDPSSGLDLTGNISVRSDKELYLASSKTIVKKLKEIDNILDSALILAHNPGITDVLNEYFKVNLDHMPTCGVCCIWFHTDKFENILDCKTELAYFSYPSRINNG